jgi:hypothetical protein
VGRDLVSALAQRVDEVARDVVAFARVGDALLSDRARRVVAVDQRQVVGRNADRKPLAFGAKRAFDLALGQRQGAGEIVRGGDRVP